MHAVVAPSGALLLVALVAMAVAFGWRIASLARHGLRPVPQPARPAETLGLLLFMLLLFVWAYETVAYAGLIRHLLPTTVVPALASPWARTAGTLMLATGPILYIVALRDLGESWRLGIDRGGPGPLVTRGVYRWSRNPIYLSVILWLAGGFLIVASLSLGVLAVAAILLLHLAVLTEERFLRERNGPAYDDYRRRVGRYLTAPWRR